MKHIFLPLVLLFTCSLPLRAQWERVASHAGGQVNALARTPDTRLWAGTRTGLFHSADNGISWSREVGVAPTWTVQDAEVINGELKTLSVQSLGHPAYRVVLSEQGQAGSFSHTVVPALNPGNTNGRGGIFEVNSCLVAWSGSQIALRTAVTWSLIQLPAFSLYDVHGNETLIAAAVQETGNDLSRLRFTVNNGNSWETPALPGASATEHVVAVHVRGSRIWAIYGNGDLFLSEDSGQSWAKMTSPSLPGFSYSQTRFRWDEVMDRLMICVAGILYTSADLGATWVSAGTVLQPQEVQDFLPEGNMLSVGGTAGFSRRLTSSGPFAQSNGGLQGDPAFDVKTYGSESFAVYTTGVQRTTDGGTTWAALNIGPLSDADFREIRGFEKNGDRIYLLTNTGVLVSADNGATWPGSYAWSGSAKSLQFGAPGELWLTGTQSQTVTVVSEADPAQVMRTFSTLLTPGTNDNLYFVYYDPWDGNILGYLPESATIYASANKGKDWVIRSALPGPLNLAGKFYQASGSNGRLFFLSSNAIYYSTDHATSWTASGGSTGGMGAFMEMVEMGGNLYALSLSKGLLRSINNGTTWLLAFNNATDIRAEGLATTTTGGEPRLLIGSRDRGVWRYNPAISTSPFKLESGKTTLCPGAGQEFCLASLPQAYCYSWLLPAQSGVAGTVANPVIQAGDAGRCLDVFFNQNSNSTALISVTYDGDAWPVSVTAGFQVLIKALNPTILPAINVPFESLPFQVPLTGDQVPATPGTYTYTQVLDSYLGCDSIIRQTVTVLTPQLGTVIGSVYWDNNNNGMFNSSTDKWAEGIIIRSSSGLFATTGPDGKYVLKGLSVGDTVRVEPPMSTTVSFPGYMVHQPGVWSGNFRLYTPSSLPDLSIDLTNTTVFRSGFVTEVVITCRNTGLQLAQNAEVKVMIPDFMILDDFIPAPTQQTGNTLTWYLGTLAFNEVRTLRVYILTPVGTPLNTPVIISGMISPLIGDAIPENNSTRISSWIRNSYDPNDKQVSPAYVTPAMLANQEKFYYTIRFQNTGNFPADFVRITDTLSADVNPATFRFVSSSHPCTWRLLGKGVVEFMFDNIQLPDSTSDEPGSHGFVKFSIKADAYLPLGTVVENRADIYFDYNPPIRTNTIGTQVVYFLPGEPPAGDELALRPNPAAFRAYCSWENPLPTDGLLRLFDLRGLLQMEIPVGEGSTEASFEVMSLAPGNYLVVLESGQTLLLKTLIVMPPWGLELGKQ